MDNESIFQNRELSWLSFNRRVLEEAQNCNHPLLERLKFIAIASSNLDEFFMIRVGGLNELATVGYKEHDASGMIPKEQLDKITEEVRSLAKEQTEEWFNLVSLIEDKGIKFADINNIQKELKDHVAVIFEKQIFPAVTPLALDPTHPFPFIYTNTLNIICTVVAEDGEENFAVIPVPGILPRFFITTWNETKYLFFIEDILKLFIDRFFLGHEIHDYYVFRITRNADVTLNDDEAEDLILEMEGLIKQRRKGNVIRLEIRESFHEKYIELFKKELEIKDFMVYKTSGPVDFTFGFALASELSKHITGELFPPFKPYVKKIGNIFDCLKNKAFILHHPYDSFDPVVEFLKQAAEDPNVLAIKQTLYRSSGQGSKVVKQLLKAAENGKQVTVLLELKARFDEEKNIEWAKKLEEEGVHVIYGVQGLKTHAKILLVVRKEENGLIRRYMHFGTGNYNEKTAALYTDISFLTASVDLAYDASNFFNYLTGYSIEPSWRRISISPSGIKNKILKLIDNEISKQTSHANSLIIAKMNSLLDVEIIEKLYDASKKGVKIKLIIRGICGIRAGIKGLSENIEVYSIVGRFLEHSRIFYFKNAGDELVYISSADWMPRNLERRVELMIPIDKPDLKKQIIQILEYNLKDNINSRESKDITSARVNSPKSKKKQFDCHNQFIELSAEKTKLDEMQSKETLSTLKTFT